MAIEIPKYLDDFIFNELGGCYQTGQNVDNNIDNDENENKTYIGTYFPRSLVECFIIFHELYQIQIIKNSIDGKQSLKILDIGTGTGGNLVGLMFFLKKIKFSSENVEFYTIDGNKNAIEYQVKFFKKFNAEHKTHFRLKYVTMRIDSIDTFKPQLENYLNQKDFKFDIITSFKFISEFYNIDHVASSGLYTLFSEIIAKYLSKNGLFLILDLVSGNFDRNRPRPYTTQIMSDELNKYVKADSENMQYVIPICCAKWSCNCKTQGCYTERKFRIKHSHKQNDLSKVCYRFFTHPFFAQQIVSTLPNHEKYQMSENSYHPRYCKSTILYEMNSDEEIANAFKI